MIRVPRARAAHKNHLFPEGASPKLDPKLRLLPGPLQTRWECSRPTHLVAEPLKHSGTLVQDRAVVEDERRDIACRCLESDTFFSGRYDARAVKNIPLGLMA
jgi:hypothetical protein